MALSEAQIYDIATDWFVDGWAVARAIKMVEQVDAMPFPVARQVLKVARARLKHLLEEKSKEQ